MTNRHQPHVLVLPEDDANRQIANGFLMGLDQPTLKQIQVLPPAGGWKAVLHEFESNHVVGMDRYSGRYMVLLIDFDGQAGRLNVVKQKIPQHLQERVFFLGWGHNLLRHNEVEIERLRRHVRPILFRAT
ncbi:MAG TPA: hypothetical protein VMH81_11740 [Bryobacteraceae bacterium]|nr:hypothetical protein [Bryobacteraceae bacterium]